MVDHKGPTYRELAEKYPEAQATVRMVEALLVAFPARDHDRLREILDGLYEAGYEPSEDPFLRSYTADGRITLTVAPGVTAQMPLSRTALALQLAEIEQDDGDLARAIEIVESVEPTTIAAVSLAELYAETSRWADVVDLTNGVTNDDEPATYLLMQRGRALREQGYFEASREAIKEALRVRSRPVELRNLAYLERGQTYLAENKLAMARKDFERILATDAEFPGVHQWITAAGGAPAASEEARLDDQNMMRTVAAPEGAAGTPAVVTSKAEQAPSAEPKNPPVRIHGYGADLELNDQEVRILFGRIAAGLTGTSALHVPYSQIEEATFKDANMLVNGYLGLRVSDAPAAYAVPPTTRPIEAAMCGVHFRRKDNEAFRAGYQLILNRQHA